jgi:hypothetical protein
MLMRLHNVQRFYSTFRVSFNMTTPSSSKQDSFAMKVWKRKFNVVDQPPYQPPKHLADIISLVKKTDRTREETEQVITRVNQLSESDAESLSLAMSLDQLLYDGFKSMMTNWDFRCPSCESHRKTAAEGNCMVAWSVCSTCQRQYCNSGCVRERGCGKKQCYKCAANCEACDSKLTATASASEPPAQQGSAKRAKPELQLKLVDGSAEEERLLRSAPTLSKDSAARASILMAKQAFAMQQKFNSIGSDKKAPVAIPATRSQVPQEYFDELENGGRRQLWFDEMKRDILSVCEQHGAVAQQKTLHIAVCLGIHARLQKNWLFEDIADLKWYAKTASISSHKLVARGLVVEKFTTNAQPSIFKGMNSVNKFYVDSFTDPMVESFADAFKPLVVNGCTLTVYMPKQYKVPLELEVVELPDKPTPNLASASSASSSSASAAPAAGTAAPMETEVLNMIRDDALALCCKQAERNARKDQSDLLHLLVFLGECRPELDNSWLFDDVMKIEGFKQAYVQGRKIVGAGLKVDKQPINRLNSRYVDNDCSYIILIDAVSAPMLEEFIDKGLSQLKAEIIVYKLDSKDVTRVKRERLATFGKAAKTAVNADELEDGEVAPMEDVSEEVVGDSKDSKDLKEDGKADEPTEFQKWHAERVRTCDICKTVGDKALPYWDGEYDPEMNGARMCDPCWLEMKQKVGEIAAAPAAQAPPFPAIAP